MNILLKRGSRGENVRYLQKLLKVYPDGIFGINTEEAVKAFQKAHNIKPDGIVGPLTWAHLLSNSSKLKKSKRVINEIIVHCTATPAGKDYTVDDIRRWHKAQGWSDVGYHYIVYRDGTVHEGRNIDIAGAHTLNHNQNSIGVVYIGGMTKDNKKPADSRTNAQKDALVQLLKELRQLYPSAKIYGHRNFANKACPSFDAKKEYSNI